MQGPRTTTIRRGCALALAALTLTPSAGAYHLEDGLRGGTVGHAVGGAFMADGWHVTDRTDRIWYAVPRLVSGSVEFTISNVTMSSLTDTRDNELFAMYEAGYGIAEPISYSDFRENHYKCMLRVYANGEVGRAGFQKLMWGMCPGGAPGHGSCACGTSFFEEPFAGPGGWDGSAVRFRVAWGDGHTRLYRNGAEVLEIDWSRSGLTFGPSEMHLSLGTSRPSAVGEAQLPVGAVFTDLVIDGTEGPLAVCPGAAPMDAGAPDVGVIDAGAPSMNVIDLPAVEDVTVAPTHPTTVYPDANDLSVGEGDSEFYVKFRVPSFAGRVVRAQLILHSGDYSSARGTGASVYAAASASWSEGSLAWGARPGPRGSRLARINGVEPDQVYTVDLGATAVSAPGDIAFAVLPEAGDRDSAHFDAREVSPSRGPRLRLTVDPTAPAVDAGSPAMDVPTAVDVGGVDVATPDISVVRDAGATPDVPVVRDVSAADAGTADVGAAGDDGLLDLPEDSSGCACRASTATTAGRGWWALALAALALRRRRQRA